MVKLGPLKEYLRFNGEKSCVFLSDLLSPEEEKTALFIGDYYINVKEHWLGRSPKYRGFHLYQGEYDKQRTITYEQLCSWKD